MSLTPDEVRHIARLARLGVTDEDIDKFSHQLSDILDYFEELNRVDVSDVPPSAYALDLHNIMRSDDPDPSSAAEDVLANAPMRENGFFRVRAILEE
jgi:aspartyl-tRNA(Asn)/glutamyl-tRNA(Gln) amidotransferase subunit C